LAAQACGSDITLVVRITTLVTNGWFDAADRGGPGASLFGVLDARESERRVSRIQRESGRFADKSTAGRRQSCAT